MTDGVNLQKHQTNVLEVKNLKKIYGPRTVVKDVSLSIKSGEVVGLDRKSTRLNSSHQF